MSLVLVVPMLVAYPINGTQYDVNNTHFWWTNSNERNAKLVVIFMSVRKLKCVKWVQWSSFSEWNIQLNALNNTLRWDHESLQKFTLNLLDIKKRKMAGMPKKFYYYGWMPLRLRNKLNSQFHFAVSSPIAVEVLHLIRNPIIHTRSHIRTVDAKVLLRLLFLMQHTTRYMPFTVVVELTPLLCTRKLSTLHM